MKTYMMFFVVMAILVAQENFGLDNYTDYIVISDNVNIRENASLHSRIVGNVSFPTILKVYKIKGSGNYQNGIYDRWAKISNEKSEWINMFYITSFPFVASSRNEYYYGPDDYSTIIVKDFFYVDKQLFFRIEKNLNGYYHKDIEYNILANDEIQNIRIIDNPWTRLFHFCEDFVNEVKKSNPNIKETWRIEIENETINLSYGIHVGMDWVNAKNILGSAYETQDIVWYSKKGYIYSYAAMYVGYGYWVRFYVVDEKIVKIEYSIEK